MKKFILIILLLTMGYNSYAQNNNQQSQNSKFEDLMIQYVGELAEGIKSGTDMLVTEAPIVIQQYLMFEAVRAWFQVGIAIIVFILGFIIIPRTVTEKVKPEKESYGPSYRKTLGGRYLKDGSSAPTGEEIAYYASKVLGPLIGIVMFFHNILDAVKVTFFPKLYLVETFINIMT